MSKEHTPDWIMTFLRAVYSENAELAAASFNEEKAIRDATEIIHELMVERDRLAGQVKTLLELLRLSKDIVDDSLEERAPRHSLGNLSARIRTALSAPEPEKETHHRLPTWAHDGDWHCERCNKVFASREACLGDSSNCPGPATEPEERSRLAICRDCGFRAIASFGALVSCGMCGNHNLDIGPTLNNKEIIELVHANDPNKEKP